MIDDKLIGAKTELVPMKVTRKDVHQFCHVIDEKNPLYHNLYVAKKAGYEDTPLPPTYPTLFWQQLEIPWLQNDSTMILSEQAFSYKDILTANKTYHCQIELQNVRTRRNQQFIVHRLSIYDGDKLAATSDTTTVLLYQEDKE